MPSLRRPFGGGQQHADVVRPELQGRTKIFFGPRQPILEAIVVADKVGIGVCGVGLDHLVDQEIGLFLPLGARHSRFFSSSSRSLPR